MNTPSCPYPKSSFLGDFSGDYCFSFQLQEIDPEYLSGAVSFKYRVHDARIGRFLSVDPLAPEYPWNSSYAFSENRVIDAIELEGLESVLVNVRQWINSEDELVEVSSFQFCTPNEYGYGEDGILTSLISEVTNTTRAIYMPAVEVAVSSQVFEATQEQPLENSAPLVQFGNDKLKINGNVILDNNWFEGSDDGANTGGKYGGKDGYENGGKQIMFATWEIATLPISAAAGGFHAIVGYLGAASAVDDAITDTQGTPLSTQIMGEEFSLQINTTKALIDVGGITSGVSGYLSLNSRSSKLEGAQEALGVGLSSYGLKENYNNVAKGNE